MGGTHPTGILSSCFILSLLSEGLVLDLTAPNVVVNSLLVLLIPLATGAVA